MPTFDERLARLRTGTQPTTTPVGGGGGMRGVIGGLASKALPGLGPIGSLLSYLRKPYGVTDITGKRRVAEMATGTPERQLVDVLSPFFQKSTGLGAKERFAQTMMGEAKGLGEVGLNIAGAVQPIAKAMERRGILFKPGEADFPTRLKQLMRTAVPTETAEAKIGEAVGRTLPTMALWSTGAKGIETPLAKKIMGTEWLGRLAKPLAWGAYRAGATPIIQPLISEGTTMERLKKIPGGVAGDIAMSAILHKLGWGKGEWEDILKVGKKAPKIPVPSVPPVKPTEISDAVRGQIKKLHDQKLSGEIDTREFLDKAYELAPGIKTEQITEIIRGFEPGQRITQDVAALKKGEYAGLKPEEPAIEKLAREGLPGESVQGEMLREFLDEGDIEGARGFVGQLDESVREKKAFQRLLDTLAPGEKPRVAIPDVATQQQLRAAGLSGAEMVEATKKVSAGQSVEEAIGDTKYAFNINKNRMALSPEAKSRLSQAVEVLKPELEKVKGGPLTEAEIIKASQTVDILHKTVSRKKTEATTAALTRLRQAVAAGAKEEQITPEFVQNVKVLSSWAADTGRRLKAFDITANPIKVDVKTKIISELAKLGKDTDEIIKAAKGIDFDNPKQVTKFYRQFVKPGFSEVVDEFRYINMLSSPKTHNVNVSSGLTQATILNPATKLYSGMVDFVQSGLTGKKRTHYVSEVPAYYRGLFNSVGEAVVAFKDSMAGRTFIGRPDVARMPTGVKLLEPLRVIPRFLEAQDVFFRTLIKGGAMESIAHGAAKSGKEIALSEIEKKAMKEATYYVFRSALDPSNKTGQGVILSWIDKVTKSMYGFRKVPGVKWFLPFLQTPLNILKEGVEYSPMGFLTTIGAKDTTEQIGKALLGSTVMAGAAWLGAKGDITWAAPRNKKDKELFYATGRKPYSIKLGDKWYGYDKIGPLAYPIAMAAAAHYYYNEDPDVFTDENYEKMINTAMGVVGFFADQSYVQGMGNIIKWATGEPGSLEKVMTNIPRQVIPLVALQGWVARFIDPYYRKAETPLEAIKAGIPGLSKTLPPYTTPIGTPSERETQKPLGLPAAPYREALLPFQVGTEQPAYEPLYQHRQGAAKVRSIKKALGEVKSPEELRRLLEKLGIQGLLKP